jgi:AcrR family transcriptional regulator
MDAAAQVFAERGFHGASTQDVADVLGIRQASLYYYFPSKEVALEEVCTRGVEGFLEAAIAVAGAPGTARDKLARLIEAHLSPLLDRREYMRMFLNERQHLPNESRRRIGRLSWAYERLIEDIVRAGVRDGECRLDINCRITALALLGMTNTVAAWFSKEPRTAVEKIASEFVRLLLSGIGSDVPSCRAKSQSGRRLGAVS